MTKGDLNLSFNIKIKKELCGHYDNNFDFDNGEFIAIKNYIDNYDLNSKRDHDYIYERFDFLKEKYNSAKNKTNILDKLCMSDVINSMKKNKLELARGFLAGKFICNGIFSGLNKNYNLEFFSNNISDAEDLNKILGLFEIKANIVKRKKYFINYIRESEAISDFFRIIGANNSFIEFENIRILKDLRNNINRGVNFETANINKVIAASVKQINNINYILNNKGLDYLCDDLKKVAIYRLKYKHASLKELTEKFDGHISKSSLHYKLKLINQIADNLKKHKDDDNK